MIDNLASYFNRQKTISLENVEYKRIRNSKKADEYHLICEESVSIELGKESIDVILERKLYCDPENLFTLAVSFSAVLKFNEEGKKVDWEKYDLSKLFESDGNFITNILAARASILIGEITASFGQNPIVLPPTVQKKGEIS